MLCFLLFFCYELFHFLFYFRASLLESYPINNEQICHYFSKMLWYFLSTCLEQSTFILNSTIIIDIFDIVIFIKMIQDEYVRKARVILKVHLLVIRRQKTFKIFINLSVSWSFSTVIIFLIKNNLRVPLI